MFRKPAPQPAICVNTVGARSPALANHIHSYEVLCPRVCWRFSLRYLASMVLTVPVRALALRVGMVDLPGHVSAPAAYPIIGRAGDVRRSDAGDYFRF